MTTDALTPQFNDTHAKQPARTIARKKSPSPFCLRLSQQQWETLKRDAKGEPLGPYARRLIFGGDGSLSPKKTKPVHDGAALGQALSLLGQSRLSSNLNQLAKLANSGALNVTPDVCRELTKSCEAVNNIRSLLVTALGVRGRRQ
jgi:mobilization protein MobC